MISVRLSSALAVARIAALAAGLPAMIFLAGCGSQLVSASAASPPAQPVLGRLAGDFSHGAGFGKVDGGVTTDGFAKWIELNSFQWAVHRSVTSGAGGKSRESSAPM